MNTDREIAYRLDPVLWMQDVLGITPRPWQENIPTHASAGRIHSCPDRTAGWQNNRRRRRNGPYSDI